jgi:kexin
MDAPGILIKRAMLNAVQNGRGGKGSIYVFASGNGAGSEDNCNFDGYTNSIYSITVGAVDRKGLHPYYSEKCSAQLVVTYSSGSGDQIHTTDVGTNTCTSSHGGTSAAAPLAAGIFALVLSIRPDLTWRDMQYLIMQTAVPIDPENGEWQTTTIGRKFSHTFGYGKIDTWAAVEAAKTFKNVKPQAWYYSPWIHVNQDIPQGDVGLAVTIDVIGDMLKDANLERVEHVTVTMNVEHGKRGDLSVELISPDGVTSHLSATRRYDVSTEGYADWTFMSVVHWYVIFLISGGIN